MSIKRDLKLSDYDISKARYNELKYFCIQYHEKKAAIKDIGLKAINYHGGSKGNHINKVTEDHAIKKVMLQEEIDLIEKTAVQAGGDVGSYILKSVTEGLPFEYMDIPLSRTKFYDARRYFFYLLSKER